MSPVETPCCSSPCCERARSHTPGELGARWPWLRRAGNWGLSGQIVSPFTSSRAVPSSDLGLWWLQFPNGFLIWPSHLPGADEGCASLIPCPSLSFPPEASDGERLLLPPLRVDPGSSALHPLAYRSHRAGDGGLPGNFSTS